MSAIDPGDRPAGGAGTGPVGGSGTGPGRAYDWTRRVVATVSQDRAGRLAVATVRLGLAVLSSGLTLLPWPTQRRLDALFVAAGEPQDHPFAGEADARLDTAVGAVVREALIGVPAPVGAGDSFRRAFPIGATR